METIKIKYHDDDLVRLEKIAIGDWIDLRAAEDVDIPDGQYRMISLGVSMQLPEGYYAEVAPRSSTFKNYGIIMANSIGVIDESYCGDNDVWRFPAYCISGNNYNIVTNVYSTRIKKNDRICQFRIVKKMPEIEFVEVETLGNKNRGGIGSTGIK